MGGMDDQQNHPTADRYVYSFVDDSSDTDTDTSRSTRQRRKLEDPDAELRKKREKLNVDIATEVGLDIDGRNPLNIAIVGKFGVGKSSTINTLLTAMNDDKYREYAITGNFGGLARQMTYLTKSFPKKAYRKPAYPNACYPTFIDIAGFDDEENDLSKELLRIVFYGRLPVEDSLKGAKQVFDETGMKGLREKYSQNLELLKLDRIIFVASAREAIPEKLITCVMEAANPVGAKAGKGKMTIPVFGIMTKVDGIDLDSSEFKEREKKFLECLGLVGARQRYARLCNYCSEVDVNDERLEKYLPKIDVPALKFLRQILDPVYEVQAGHETFTDTCPKPEEPGIVPETIPEPPRPEASVLPFSQPVGPHSPPLTLLLTYAIKGILIALFVYVCLAPTISSKDLLSICTSYDKHVSMNPHGFKDGHLTNICNRKMDIIGKSLMGPLIVFVILIVLMDFLMPSLIQYLTEKIKKPKTD
ncbi:uncharacterized protein LOC117340341 [Pecten maximus]|uniref:uncharacterized protein LOC117340341 n=1 Tax=Pecten maximus TaxID=6579 RepID=UPI0014590398|nr:uncharacterized protein LOC117340341 [Pecten maximus]XP_033757995.1 uncharacterized protein LOC117340341 [Pecten maximus]